MTNDELSTYSELNWQENHLKSLFDFKDERMVLTFTNTDSLCLFIFHNPRFFIEDEFCILYDMRPMEKLYYVDFTFCDRQQYELLVFSGNREQFETLLKKIKP